MSGSSSPLARHVARPAELAERLDVERRGVPFIVYRDQRGEQVIRTLDDQHDRLTIGRGDSCDVRLEWDTKVSRLHAELVWVGGHWTVCDDGLSRNGTTVGGERVRGQRRLDHGDLIEFGRTIVAYCEPARADSGVTEPVTTHLVKATLSAGDRDVLRVLVRPLISDSFAAPATNAEIADELHLSVQAIKSRLHSLFERFELQDLPQNQKRSRLAAHVLRSGVVDEG